MSTYIEKAGRLTIPVIPLRGMVAYPGIPLSFELSRDFSIAACEAASAQSEMLLFLVAQKDLAIEEPTFDDLYRVGTIVKIKQTLKTPEGNLRVIVDGLERASVLAFAEYNDYIIADVMTKTVLMPELSDARVDALNREIMAALEKMISFMPSSSEELLLAVKSIRDPGVLADFIAANVLVKMDDKQQILEIADPIARAEALTVILAKETKIIRYELDIHKKVRARIDKNQKDYYLREQLKVIQNELDGEGDSDIDEYMAKIEKAKDLPKEVREKLIKETERLSKLPFASPESAVLTTHIDSCLEIPWGKKTKDRNDIDAARKVLDKDHDGLEKIKERILEFLAVKQLNPELRNQILCLVGPPGVGKTSLAASVARALKRKYVRISLGGVRDEADIRGHRKTYVGAMPGRIIHALSECQSLNPVMLLDEVDKIGADMRGDPAAALLEVLDGEQNKNFRDHFIELPVDLSDTLFIATANTLDTVPRPLIDRMEIIELHSYTANEKLRIAKNHLIPKQLKRHGLTKRTFKISDDAIRLLIDGYTYESGVRNLEREIASLCRKAAKKLIEEKLSTVSVTAENLTAFLGGRKVLPETIDDTDYVGVVNGLAYTEAGGDLLKVEVAIMEGTGKVELTGTLGNVMKESAQIAVSYIRAHANELRISPDFYTKKDIHVHVPEGATPKDGPSAGVTMLTALVSALSGVPVRRDVAMTGEITLTGRVLAIGGLREKTSAAYAAGVRTILIPNDNMKDLENIDEKVRTEVTFIPLRTAADVLAAALVKKAADAPEAENYRSTILPITESAPVYAQTSV
ncbi:MAG: endopeptidase La [Clostridia bacterium]|nr:endopeptidase La [Clostridia bacterium]